MPERVVLDSQQVDRWRRELQEAEEQIQALNRRAALLRHRIASAPLFLTDDPDFTLSQPNLWERDYVVASLRSPEAERLRADVPLREGIRALLGRGKAMTRMELRSALIAAGVPESRLGLRQATFYTALSRMLKEGEVLDAGDGALVLPGRRPKEES